MACVRATRAWGPAVPRSLHAWAEPGGSLGGGTQQIPGTASASQRAFAARGAWLAARLQESRASEPAMGSYVHDRSHDQRRQERWHKNHTEKTDGISLDIARHCQAESCPPEASYSVKPPVRAAAQDRGTSTDALRLGSAPAARPFPDLARAGPHATPVKPPAHALTPCCENFTVLRERSNCTKRSLKKGLPLRRAGGGRGAGRHAGRVGL
jgi:hypothetical protein